MRSMFVADTQVKGLFQKKGVTGDKWVVKAKQRGINKPVTVTLGRVDVIQVRDARRLAREKLAILAQGINPNTQDKKARATDQYLGITLEQALSEYLNLRQLKPSTLTSYRQVVARSFADWLHKPLREISRRDVLSRYQDIQNGIAKRAIQPEKANVRGLAEAQKAMRYLSAIMNSYANDTYQGKSVLPDGNPVRVLSDKRVRSQLKPRRTFLNTSARTKIFDVIALAHHPSYCGKIKPQHADFVYLLLITGMRFQEARLLRWQNIDSWSYTITDTKNGVDHVLPITPSVKQLFERNRFDSDWLFAGREGKPLSMSSAVANVAEEAKLNFTAHDLRRTAATIASEHGFTRDQIGRLLNHSDGNVTESYIQKTASAFLPILEVIERHILGQDIDDAYPEDPPMELPSSFD